MGGGELGGGGGSTFFVEIRIAGGGAGMEPFGGLLISQHCKAGTGLGLSAGGGTARRGADEGGSARGGSGIGGGRSGLGKARGGPVRARGGSFRALAEVIQHGDGVAN